MEFIINIIFWTLALYGLFEIIKNIIYISTYTNFKSDGIYVIIAVKVLFVLHYSRCFMEKMIM